MSKKWVALLCGYLLFLASAVAFFQFPPLINQIDADIAISDFDIGLIQGLYALPAVLLALVGGLWIDTIDSRRSGSIAGVMLLGGNLLFTLGGSLPLMLVGRLLVGIATILINLLVARMLTIWFPPQQRGLSMSVLHTGWPVAAGLSYSTFVELGALIGWQPLLLLVCGFIAAVVLLFILAAPCDPPQALDDEPRKPILSRVLRLPADLWKSAVAWFMFTGSMMGILTFGAKHLEHLGIDYSTGNLWVGFLMLVAIPGSLVAGRVIDWFGSIRLYLLVPPVLTAACLFGFTLGYLPWLMTILAGTIAAFTPIAVYAVPGLVVKPRRLGLAFGVILTFSNLGNTVGPILIGWLNELTDSYHLGLALAAGMMSCIALVALTLRLKPAQRQTPRDQTEGELHGQEQKPGTIS